MENICRICQYPFNDEIYTMEEVRQKTGELFEYFKCKECGCVQISSFPKEMNKYYNDYYSLEKVENSNKIKSFFRKEVFKSRLFKNSLLGFFITRVKKDMFLWIEPKMFGFKSSILDIGCGNGSLLNKMAESGFSNLSGVDPYIDSSKSLYVNNVRISLIKDQYKNLTEKYDIIMLHHVIEHIDGFEIIKSKFFIEDKAFKNEYKICEVEKDITFEEDCLPHHDFFRYSKEWFTKYENNKTTKSIAVQKIISSILLQIIHIFFRNIQFLKLTNS